MKKRHTRRSFLAQGALAGAWAATPLAGFGRGLESAVEKTSLASSPSELAITDIKCGFIRNGHGLFVKVYTNQDIWGCGEGVDAVPGTYHLVKMFARRLEGKNPLNVHRLFEDIRRSGFFEGAQSGMYVAVLSAVETALWDLAGKALGLPVYQLLGGKFRDRIRVYMDTALYQFRLPTPEQFAESATEAANMGFTAIKFDLDQRNDPNIDICADMHGRYDAPTAQQVARLMEPLNLMWLEEPIPAENVEAYKHLTESTSTPICAGENLYLAHGFRRLLELGAVDIIMPDLQKAGGLGEGQRIANLSNLYYVPFAPHMVASYLGAMASCHVCASVPNFMVLEWQTYFHSNSMFTEIVSFDGPMVEDGFIPLSEKPGIGVEINEEGMRRYATEGIPFFE